MIYGCVVPAKAIYTRMSISAECRQSVSRRTSLRTRDRQATTPAHTDTSIELPCFIAMIPIDLKNRFNRCAASSKATEATITYHVALLQTLIEYGFRF